eukprot:gene1239-11328_t
MRYFNNNYQTSRQKFIEYSSNADIHQSFPLCDSDGKTQLIGVNGEELYIDICVFGNIKNPENILLHTVGVHGIEGYGTSAIQLKFLSENLNSKNVILKKTAAIFIHSVNPYGMSFYRRVNDSNVDLNRNFFYEIFDDKIEGKERCTPYEERGTSTTYLNLNSYLNPNYDDISYFDSYTFYFKTILHIIQESFLNFQQNLFEGQNSFPNGLFFGGTKLEQEPNIIFKFLTDFLTKTIPGKNLKKFIHVDAHTGIGSYGESLLIVDDDSNGKYSKIFGSKVKQNLYSTTRKTNTNIGYMVKGSLNYAISDICNRLGVEYYGICQEFGTVGITQVLHALRVENSAFQKEGALKSDAPERIQLLNIFYPKDNEWKRRCLNDGISCIHKCISLSEE